MWCLTDLWILFYSYILWNKNVEFVQELFYDILITGSLRMTVKEIVIFNWKQGAFFYWLTVGKTSAKNTQNTTYAVGSVGLGGWNYFSEAFLLEKESKKAICLLFSPDGSDTVFNVQRALRQSSGWRNGNQECPSLSLLF